MCEIDKNAAIQGLVSIRYNSAEEHFLGYAEVVVINQVRFAQASLLVDVKPGKWRVAIGSRKKRIIFVPGCAGWSPTGWLDLNETVADLASVFNNSGGGSSPKVDLGFIGFYVEVQASIAFDIQAKVQYKPSFALLEAGIWVDVWASIIAHYKLLLKDWKSKTLVDIYILGDLFVIFQPPPTLVRGTLDGIASIVSFKVDFHAKVEKTI